MRAAPALALAAACTAPAPAPAAGDLADRLWQAHRERVETCRGEFHARVAFPRVIRGNDGTLVISRAVLEGLPGQEYLRLRFTYVNETDRTFDLVQVRFAVRDGFDRVRGTEAFELVMPMLYRFTPGSSYTDERHLPTFGAHDAPGWDFQVEVRGSAQ